jgi:hypothetical protein
MQTGLDGLTKKYDQVGQAQSAVTAAGRALSSLQSQIAQQVAAGTAVTQEQADAEARLLEILGQKKAARAGLMAPLTELASSNSDTVVGITRLSAAQKEGTVTTGQQAFALQQLKIQATQAFSGILTGQPIMATLI